MADGLDEQGGLARAVDEHAVEAPVARAATSSRRAAGASLPHSHKFRAATGMLAGIAIGAIVIAVALALHGSGSSSKGQWSSWSPPDSGIQGARDIADHVAPLYRLSGVDQLAVVTVVDVDNSPGAAAGSSTGSSTSASSGLTVAVRQDPTSSAISLIGGNTIAYNLCGIGTANCAIGSGAPSADRLLLLRREALELALYTFKYISGTQNVLAILPPGISHPVSTLTAKPPASGANAQGASGKPLNVALLFLRDELQPLLDEPLSTTLPLELPPMVSQLNLWKQTPEADLVAQITSRGMFSEQRSQAQDGSNLIVLQPLPPQ